MFQNYKTKTLKKDILSGIIVALVSIPISMGYAQVAGLPVVYGLYGSLLPILVFSLITSSPQFVFGVDATPAALVGATLASLGIVTGSGEAIRLVPVITLVTAGWLLLFYIVRAGKLVSYISTPVMGGFISGIGCTIILMQVAKLFGGSAGTGELFVLIAHILNQLQYFNLLSAVLGIGTIVIILTAKKYVPKFPMSVVLMAVGAALTAVFHIDRYGVKLLPQVSAGLPKLAFPDISVLGEKEAKEATIKGLNSAEGYIRRQLARNLNLRNTPEIRFILDESIEYGVNMSKLIDDVTKKDSNSHRQDEEQDEN